MIISQGDINENVNLRQIRRQSLLTPRNMDELSMTAACWEMPIEFENVWFMA